MGVINIHKDKKPPKGKLKTILIVVGILASLVAILSFFGLDDIFKKNKTQQNPQENYEVTSENQSGGVTVGKIENVIILTDEESLGIREHMGLYKDGKKVGMVVNPIMDEEEMLFTIDEIQFDKHFPSSDLNYIFSLFEFDKYVIQATHAGRATVIPPSARGIKGKIIEIK